MLRSQNIIIRLCRPTYYLWSRIYVTYRYLKHVSCCGHSYAVSLHLQTEQQDAKKNSITPPPLLCVSYLQNPSSSWVRKLDPFPSSDVRQQTLLLGPLEGASLSHRTTGPVIESIWRWKQIQFPKRCDRLTLDDKQSPRTQKS